ncbi:MAG: DUF4494 family protein [Dysgonomonas mossii]|nr:DUF4494 family protein [Dysgonomonas mossii]MBS7112565.1 DUF4494 family protein [Dysgonomonas mossii]
MRNDLNQTFHKQKTPTTLIVSASLLTEPDLVDTLSFTEAESRIIEEIRLYISGEFTISDIKRARLSEIFLNENGDRYFKTKIYFVTLDEKSGSEKKTTVTMLAQASSLKEALEVVEKGMSGTLADYEIASLSETAIMDIFPYDRTKVEKQIQEPDMFKDGYEDPLFEQSKALVIEKNTATTSMLQRQFSIGYNRAERLMDELERKGVVGSFNGASPREVIYNAVGMT